MKSNDLCDELGLDTISCGDTVASFLASEGAFGDAELVHDTVRKIAYREGIGDVLAEGIARSHEELGVPNWTSKGLEFPAHEGRVCNGQALSYATSNHGADHNYSAFFVREYPLVPSVQALPPQGFENDKPAEVIEHENLRALIHSGIIYQFSRSMMNSERYERLFREVYTNLLQIGAKVVELERHFNNERGFTRSDDTLPYEIDGMESALAEYYELRGWNADGTVPKGGTVTSL